MLQFWLKCLCVFSLFLHYECTGVYRVNRQDFTSSGDVPLAAYQQPFENQNGVYRVQRQDFTNANDVPFSNNYNGLYVNRFSQHLNRNVNSSHPFYAPVPRLFVPASTRRPEYPYLAFGIPNYDKVVSMSQFGKDGVLPAIPTAQFDRDGVLPANQFGKDFHSRTFSLKPDSSFDDSILPALPVESDYDKALPPISDFSEDLSSMVEQFEVNNDKRAAENPIRKRRSTFYYHPPNNYYRSHYRHRSAPYIVPHYEFRNTRYWSPYVNNYDSDDVRNTNFDNEEGVDNIGTESRYTPPVTTEAAPTLQNDNSFENVFKRIEGLQVFKKRHFHVPKYIYDEPLGETITESSEEYTPFTTEESTTNEEYDAQNTQQTDDKTEDSPKEMIDCYDNPQSTEGVAENQPTEGTEAATDFQSENDKLQPLTVDMARKIMFAAFIKHLQNKRAYRPYNLFTSSVDDNSESTAEEFVENQRPQVPFYTRFTDSPITVSEYAGNQPTKNTETVDYSQIEAVKRELIRRIMFTAWINSIRNRYTVNRPFISIHVIRTGGDSEGESTTAANEQHEVPESTSYVETPFDCRDDPEEESTTPVYVKPEVTEPSSSEGEDSNASSTAFSSDDIPEEETTTYSETTVEPTTNEDEPSTDSSTYAVGSVDTPKGESTTAEYVDFDVTDPTTSEGEDSNASSTNAFSSDDIPETTIYYWEISTIEDEPSTASSTDVSDSDDIPQNESTTTVEPEITKPPKEDSTSDIYEIPIIQELITNNYENVTSTAAPTTVDNHNFVPNEYEDIENYHKRDQTKSNIENESSSSEVQDTPTTSPSDIPMVYAYTKM